MCYDLGPVPWYVKTQSPTYYLHIIHICTPWCLSNSVKKQFLINSIFPVLCTYTFCWLLVIYWRGYWYYFLTIITLCHENSIDLHDWDTIFHFLFIFNWHKIFPIVSIDIHVYGLGFYFNWRFFLQIWLW